MQKRTIEEVLEEYRHKKISLIGLGVSHLPLAKMLASKGISFTVYDKKEFDQMGEEAVKLQQMGIPFVNGPDYLDQLSGDIIFRTPGMYFNNPKIQTLIADGATVTSEMEMFFECCPCPIIAITGSDGKTTTSSLIAAMLEQSGRKVHLGGNIGRALFPIVEEVKPTDMAVVELSSFQLLSMRQSPELAVITNVSPNHLDVHGTMDEYIDAKRNIIRYQDGNSIAILNAENDVTKELATEVKGELRQFSLHHEVSNGAWLRKDGMMVMSYKGEDTPVILKDELIIPGLHNVENFLTAMSAVWGIVSPEAIVKVARTFKGVEHRIEFVREINGIKWYNDSIATSPTRTMAGLACFQEKMILIAGGYDKHLDYSPLAEPLIKKVKILILTGATSPKIEKAVKEHPLYKESGISVINVKNMEAAVQKAYEVAKSGDVISLSPASASFDCYPNFEVRGNHYKDLVRALQ